MKISTGKIISRAALFAILVAGAELAFGNLNLIISLWYFEKISPWAWSLPIHLAGFALLVWLNTIFYEKSMALPITLSLLFFATGETANALYFNFFKYSDGPLGPPGSFAAVIVLYLVLCALFSFIFRADIRPKL